MKKHRTIKRKHKRLGKGDIIHISNKLDQQIIVSCGDKRFNLSQLIYKAIQNNDMLESWVEIPKTMTY